MIIEHLKFGSEILHLDTPPPLLFSSKVERISFGQRNKGMYIALLLLYMMHSKGGSCGDSN
jgi:hypothetical protein